MELIFAFLKCRSYFVTGKNEVIGEITSSCKDKATISFLSQSEVCRVENIIEYFVAKTLKTRYNLLKGTSFVMTCKILDIFK